MFGWAVFSCQGPGAPTGQGNLQNQTRPEKMVGLDSLNNVTTLRLVDVRFGVLFCRPVSSSRLHANVIEMEFDG